MMGVVAAARWQLRSGTNMRSLKYGVGSLFLGLALLFGVACSDDSESAGDGMKQPTADATGDTTPEPGDTVPGSDVIEDATPGEDATTGDAADGQDQEVGEGCSEGQVLCDGQCVSVKDDPLNCGACANRCADEQACVNRQCADTRRSCGAWAGNTCAEDEYCKFPEGAMCDFADHQGVCTPRPASCSVEEAGEVCGCDGVTYASACMANLAGSDVVSDGACAVSEQCVAMDARAEGDCDQVQVLGMAWDGDQCITLSGCSCEGADCDNLYDAGDINGTIDCHRDYDACIIDCRTLGCEDPDTSCRSCWFTYACLPENLAC